MSDGTKLTLSTHTASGNLVFKANDHTVYVCKEAMHGAEMWKSNHGGFLNTAGKLSTKNNGFELQHTACQNCGKQTNCPICRCTDAAFELDFQTSGFLDMAKKAYNSVAKSTTAANDNFQIDKKQREKDWNKYRTELCKLFKDSGGGACTDAFANALSLENMEAPWQTEHEKALALALANAQANGKSKGP
jgi:hypothetical protein